MDVVELEPVDANELVFGEHIRVLLRILYLLLQVVCLYLLYLIEVAHLLCEDVVHSGGALLGAEPDRLVVVQQVKTSQNWEAVYDCRRLTNRRVFWDDQQVHEVLAHSIRLYLYQLVYLLVPLILLLFY